MTNTEKLLELIKDNPELPIVPIVDGEIVGDDCDYWLGAWGNVQIDEYLMTDDQVVLRSDDDVFYVLEWWLPTDEYEALPETESECRPLYNALPWTRAILVYITLP